jgi:hypothetical protein
MSGTATEITIIRGVILGAIATCGLVLPCAAFAQASPESSTSPAPVSSLDHWRHTMVKTPLPGKGCFTTSYPDTEWHQVPCVTAPPRLPKPPPARRPLPPAGAAMTVGDGIDYSAQVASGTTISQAEGAFVQVYDVTSENEDGNANEFSLQLNTNIFTTPACNGISGCVGWAQFVYGNPFQSTSGPESYGAAYIQYWLIYYGATCPSEWLQDGDDCFYSSPVTEVPIQTVGSLRSITLTGAPSSGGGDTVVFSVGGTLYSVSNSTSNPDIDLAGNWNTAEFNILGDCCGTAATFNPGAALAVRSSVNNGTTNAPSCLQWDETGETNSLTLAPPCCPFTGTSDGASPGIVFLESSVSPLPTANCSVLTHPDGWLPAVLQILLQ